MRTRGVELSLIRRVEMPSLSLFPSACFSRWLTPKNNNTLISEWRSIGITRCNQIILKYVFAVKHIFQTRLWSLTYCPRIRFRIPEQIRKRDPRAPTRRPSSDTQNSFTNGWFGVSGRGPATVLCSCLEETGRVNHSCVRYEFNVSAK